MSNRNYKKTLCNAAIKPSVLKRHLESNHPVTTFWLDVVASHPTLASRAVSQLLVPVLYFHQRGNVSEHFGSFSLSNRRSETD